MRKQWRFVFHVATLHGTLPGSRVQSLDGLTETRVGIVIDRVMLKRHYYRGFLALKSTAIDACCPSYDSCLIYLFMLL